MDYSLIIENRHSDPTYKSGLETWEEVTDFIKEKLGQWAIRVQINKWSSNNRNLGKLVVTMSNLYEVVTSPNDKILI